MLLQDEYSGESLDRRYNHDPIISDKGDCGQLKRLAA